MSCVLITGASGFVGSAVVNRLAIHSDFTPRAAMRQDQQHLFPAVDVVQVGDLVPNTDWSAALQGVDAVVHLAARVHVMTDTATDQLTEFRRVNVEGTLNLARQAVAAGVRRFVLISSIKVNGESTFPPHSGPLPTGAREVCRADDMADPQDPYGISKHEAELGLRRLAAESGMEVVIIRPPLVYGPGVKANFQNIMRWIKRGVPLPLGAIHNKRSLVALDNLVDLIITCLDHPAAANQTFLVSDGEDLSTTELLQRMGLALGWPARLIPVPTLLLKAGAAVLGRRDMAQRLCGSLQVDITKAQTLLGWTPPISVDEGLRRAAQGFLHKTTV